MGAEAFGVVRILMRIRGMRVNLSLDHVAAAAMAVSVVCFTLGSASPAGLKSFGHDARWGALFVLWLVAAAVAWPHRRGRLRGIPATAAFAAVLLVGLMFVSAAWSPDARLTLERAFSFAILLSACACLAVGSARRAAFARLLLGGIVAGLAVVLVSGFALLLVRYADAVIPATTATPWRFRGLGENPNTVPMLAAIGIPLAAVGIGLARSATVRAGAGIALVLAVATLYLAGSRGALLGAVAGMLVVAAQLRPWRLAAAVAAGSVAAFVGGVVVSQSIPFAPAPAPTPTAAPQAGTGANGGSGRNASGPRSGSGASETPAPPPMAVETGAVPGRLADEVGSSTATTRRTLFGSSGRAQAWQGTIEQANQRPILGYGFGTEDIVFFDRFRTFQGGRPENSLIGIYLQLGLVGLLLLLAVGALLVAAGVRGARALRGRARLTVAGCLGGVAAGTMLMGVQSYVYAAGNLAASSLWICACLLAAAFTWTAPERG